MRGKLLRLVVLSSLCLPDALCVATLSSKVARGDCWCIPSLGEIEVTDAVYNRYAYDPEKRDALSRWENCLSTILSAERVAA